MTARRSSSAVLAACALAFFSCSEKKRAVTLADPKQGATVFQTHCSKCHSGGKPPNFADPNWQVSVTDAELDAVILNGKGPGMPPSLQDDPQALADVRAYLRALPHSR